MSAAGAVLSLALALAGGALLGAFYFGTLWLVVRRLDRVAWPAVWLGLSGILRLAMVLAVFVLLVGPQWERMVAALVGFLAVRVLLTRQLGRPGPAPGRRGHAPAARAAGPDGVHRRQPGGQ